MRVREPRRSQRICVQIEKRLVDPPEVPEREEPVAHSRQRRCQGMDDDPRAEHDRHASVDGRREDVTRHVRREHVARNSRTWADRRSRRSFRAGHCGLAAIRLEVDVRPGATGPTSPTHRQQREPALRRAARHRVQPAVVAITGESSRIVRSRTLAPPPRGTSVEDRTGRQRHLRAGHGPGVARAAPAVLEKIPGAGGGAALGLRPR